MPANTHTTASGVFRLAWQRPQKSSTIVVRLHTVNMYLPQPVASCLRSPPAGTQPPTLSPVAFPLATPSPVDFVHVRWKFECPLSPPGPFVEWYMSWLRVCPLAQSLSRSPRATSGTKVLPRGLGPQQLQLRTGYSWVTGFAQRGFCVVVVEPKSSFLFRLTSIRVLDRFGPRLMAVCAQCQINVQLLEHAQIPEL